MYARCCARCTNVLVHLHVLFLSRAIEYTLDAAVGLGALNPGWGGKLSIVFDLAGGSDHHTVMVYSAALMLLVVATASSSTT